MTLKAIILDFDGTLVESVGIKDRAFRSLFEADHPDRIDEIMAYHLAHNATLRFAKFRHVIERIVGRSFTEADNRRLSERFASLVFDAIVECPEVGGLGRFLDCFGGRVALYLVSMSPDEELGRILAARGLARRFKRVYGGSWQKADAIHDILAAEGITPEKAVFVGDAPEDRRAAEDTGVPFVGRDSGKDLGDDVPIYPDLIGVQADLQRRYAAPAIRCA